MLLVQRTNMSTHSGEGSDDSALAPPKTFLPSLELDGGGPKADADAANASPPPPPPTPVLPPQLLTDVDGEAELLMPALQGLGLSEEGKASGRGGEEEKGDEEEKKNCPPTDNDIGDLTFVFTRPRSDSWDKSPTDSAAEDSSPSPPSPRPSRPKGRRRRNARSASLPLSESLSSFFSAPSCPIESALVGATAATASHTTFTHHNPLSKPDKPALKKAGLKHSPSMCELRWDGHVDPDAVLAAEAEAGIVPSDLAVGSKKMRRNVSFNSVEVREHDVVLGDNPACSAGPPIQLGWDPGPVQKVCINKYEATRGPRRSQIEMRMGHKIRFKMLSGEGRYTMRTLNEATHRVQKERKERKKTKRQVQRRMKIEDFFASTKSLHGKFTLQGLSLKERDR